MNYFKQATPLFFLLALTGYVRADIPHLSLPSAIKAAIKDNPGLAQMQARYEAMQSIPAQVGTLPDPVISFNALNLPADSFDLSQEHMTQMQGGISQRLPFYGKLALRSRAAGFHAKAAGFDVAELRNQLIRDVKIAWWTLFYLQHALEIIDSNLKLLRQFVDIARIKYEVGEGLQQDVLLAQLELSKLLDQHIKLENAIANSSTQLNTLLAQNPDKKFTIARQVAENLPAIKPQTALFDIAEQTRALLSAQREKIHAAESQLDLAKKEILPDFNVGFFYGGRSDTLSGLERSDLVSFKLSMNLPIFAAAKQQKSIDQHSSQLKQQRYTLQDQRNQVLADISYAYSDFQLNKQQVELFKQGIIPQARQTVASMLTGYQVNKVDFLNLARSQMTLYNYETQYWKAFTQANQAIARLIAMVGTEAIYE